MVLLVIGALLVPSAARAVQTEAGTISVDPATDLDDGQTVTVDGSGWPSDGVVQIVQCQAGRRRCGEVLGFVVVDPISSTPDGSFTESVAVRAVYPSLRGERVDCRTSTCELVVQDTRDETSAASVALTFDPNTVLLPPPALSVSPGSGLEDLDRVHVDGDGFTPNATLFLGQCPAGETTLLGCHVLPEYAEIEDDGSFSTVTDLRATFFHVDHVVDCRRETCELVAALRPYGAIVARSSTAFDPDRRLLIPAQTLWVDPDEGLAPGQTVSVTGDGYLPDEELFVAQCSELIESFEACDTGATISVIAGEDGTFETDFTVQRLLETSSGATFDCLDRTCTIRVLPEGVESWIVVPVALSSIREPTLPPSPATPTAAAPQFTG